MNQDYAKKGRFFPDSEGVREAAEAVSYADLGLFFSKYVAGTDEIPWDDFFRGVGLRLVEGKNAVADAGFIASQNFDGPVTASVTAGSEAERAGLQTGDMILEINGKIVRQESSQEIAQLSAGDTITVKVKGRRGGDRELKWKVGTRDEISYALRDVDNVTAEQRERRAAWLKGEAQIPQEETH